MVKIITPSLGGRLDYNETKAPTPGLGTVFKGEDGHDYILAKASAAITANTDVILTEPGFTVAAGAGSWTSQAVAVPSGNYAWFKKKAA